MKINKLKYVYVSITIILAIFMAACGDPTSSTEDSSTIKIGMTSALTGPYSEYGEGNKRGVEIAVKQWNDRGGIDGKKIEVEMLDDQLDPDQAAVNVQRLLDNDEIVAIIGPAGSGPGLATVPITEAAGIVHMNIVPQTIEVTYPDGVDSPPRKNVFSFALQNDVESNVLGKFVGEDWKKVGLLHESTTYGQSGIDLIEDILKNDYGIEAVEREQYNQGSTDMTAQISKIKNQGAEVLVVIGLGADLSNIKKTMDRVGFDVPLVASNGALSLPYTEGAGDLVIGTFGSMIGALGENPLSPKAEEFAEAYKAEFGADRYWGTDEENPQLFMSLNVVNAYDGANVLFEAISNADSFESEDIISALESIEDFEGVNATYSFNEQQHHAITEEAVSIFHYVKEEDLIKLIKYE